MNRKAVLIGASAQGSPLPGVENEIQSWSDFLMSVFGGCWHEGEIIQVLHPSLESVSEAIKQCHSCDFSLVCFFGHGRIGKDEMGFPETFLSLDEQNEISETDLNSGCPRHMLIMNCCRNTRFAGRFKIPSIGIGKTVFSDVIRKFYDLRILRCEEGYTKIYVPENDISSGNEPSFTSKLLAMAVDFASNGSKSLSMSDAIDRIVSNMKNVNHQHHPQYIGGRRLGHFVLSVNPLTLINGNK